MSFRDLSSARCKRVGVGMALAMMLVLNGCDKRTSQPASPSRPAEATSAALPTPEQSAGSVTGMPTSAPHATATDAAAIKPMIEVLPATAAAVHGTASADTSGHQPDVSATTDAAINEPTADDAVHVIRNYYAAINRHDHEAAYLMWRDEGRASGKTAAAFAAGFADTESDTVQIGKPSDIEGAAGSRYVRVPVKVTAIQRDQTTRNYVGTYTLRRTVVDGSTDVQRQWGIHAAQLKEVP